MTSKSMNNWVCYCLDHNWTRAIWSILPSRCFHPDCEDNVLRWLEHEVNVLSGPMKGKRLLVCDDCSHKMRAASFAAGARVNHIDKYTVEYIPQALETERPEPLK